MAFDPEQARDEELISRFVVECRGQGHMLPYEDYRIIHRWMVAGGNADALLLLLAEILPDYYAKHRGRRRLPSLQPLEKAVMGRLSRPGRPPGSPPGPE